jgi:hypothetical protein
MSALQELLDFWKGYAPFKGELHPQDETYFRKRGVFDNLVLNGETHFPEPEDEKKIHPVLAAAPYCGAVKKAAVFFLNLNPGYSLADYKQEQDPYIREVLAEVLT